MTGPENNEPIEQGSVETPPTEPTSAPESKIIDTNSNVEIPESNLSELKPNIYVPALLSLIKKERITLEEARRRAMSIPDVVGTFQAPLIADAYEYLRQHADKNDIRQEEDDSSKE